MTDSLFLAPLGGGDGEKRVGKLGECDVPAPADVAGDFVQVQAAFVLRALEALLDRAPTAGDPGDFVDLNADGCVSKTVDSDNHAAPLWLRGHRPE